MNRRQFMGTAGAGVLTAGRPLQEALDRMGQSPGTPHEVATDEEYWETVARAFTVDRSLVNLNNGGVSPAPAHVQEAMKRHLDFSNNAPPYHIWRVLEPGVEGVRQRLARQWGVDSEEIAITRNASEGLMICQFGMDLERGDQVLTSNQDYPRMRDTFYQRQRREGIDVVEVGLPTPCEDDGAIVRRFAGAITDRTRMILCSHVVNLTGQILPVAKLAALGRERGIPVVVDGAHAIAHMDFKLSDLGCDYYATSLHKWLFAPIGTGMLYVRRDKIPALWPLQAASETLANDIRKFEQVGTHPVAGILAIAEALTFLQVMQPARKQARLNHLRESWMARLAAHDKVRFHTSRNPRFACAIATVEIKGVECGALYNHLWQQHRILTTPIRHADFSGIRVSPSVYTTPEELDRFVEAMERVVRDGL